MTSERQRNVQLDVLRGAAILLVFGRHIEIPLPDGPLSMFATVWYRIGWLGVDLFFALSGFLIGGLLLSEFAKHGRIDVVRFLVRRGLKLYPGYLAFIGYLLVMPCAKALVRGAAVWPTLTYTFDQYWPNLFFLQNYLWTSAGHTWSLAVEEHFYILLPLCLAGLAAIGRIRSLPTLCLWTIPVCLALRTAAAVSDNPLGLTMSASHFRFDALAIGVTIRWMELFRAEQFQKLRSYRFVMVTAGVVLWSPFVAAEPDPIFIRTIGLSGTLLGAAVFLSAAYHTHASDFGRLRGVVTTLAGGAAWIGRYSYGIYLWHVTAFGFIGREASALISFNQRSTPLEWVAIASLMVLGAIAAGVLATRLIEIPVLRLRDRFFPSRTGPDAAASGAPTEARCTADSIDQPQGILDAHVSRRSVRAEHPLSLDR